MSRVGKYRLCKRLLQNKDEIYVKPYTRSSRWNLLTKI